MKLLLHSLNQSMSLDKFVFYTRAFIENEIQEVLAEAEALDPNLKGAIFGEAHKFIAIERRVRGMFF